MKRADQPILIGGPLRGKAVEEETPLSGRSVKGFTLQGIATISLLAITLGTAIAALVVALDRTDNVAHLDTFPFGDDGKITFQHSTQADRLYTFHDDGCFYWQLPPITAQGWSAYFGSMGYTVDGENLWDASPCTRWSMNNYGMVAIDPTPISHTHWLQASVTTPNRTMAEFHYRGLLYNHTDNTLTYWMKPILNVLDAGDTELKTLVDDADTDRSFHFVEIASPY